MDKRTPEVGQTVVYHDSRNRPHPALVTAVWDSGEYSTTGVNLVFVSSDKDRTDTYGRQIERPSSVIHKLGQPAHGEYWRFEDETPNKVIKPVT